MSDVTTDGRTGKPEAKPAGRSSMRRLLFPVLVTLGAAAAAIVLLTPAWERFMETPWTRDGTVRVYVVTLAPEVAGRVVELPVGDNQYVHKGDVLMHIDPRDYRVAVEQAHALLDQATADLQNKKLLAERRQKLTDLAVSNEEKGNFDSSAQVAQGVLEQRRADLDQANINMERTTIRSPVDGWITNLQTRVGNYADKGARSLSVIDASSFWVDGYFEETVVAPIREGDPATIKLLGFAPLVSGHVESLARGIMVPNAQSDAAGLANVNPVFTWVRLAQRVPVRVHVDHVPDGVRLVAGMTATVEVHPRHAAPSATPVASPAPGTAADAAPRN